MLRRAFAAIAFPISSLTVCLAACGGVDHTYNAAQEARLDLTPDANGIMRFLPDEQVQCHLGNVRNGTDGGTVTESAQDCVNSGFLTIVPVDEAADQKRKQDELAAHLAATGYDPSMAYHYTITTAGPVLMSSPAPDTASGPDTDPAPNSVLNAAPTPVTSGGVPAQCQGWLTQAQNGDLSATYKFASCVEAAGAQNAANPQQFHSFVNSANQNANMVNSLKSNAPVFNPYSNAVPSNNPAYSNRNSVPTSGPFKPCNGSMAC